jgi:hypothetical protein
VSPAEPDWVGTGHQQEIPAARLAAAADRMDAAYAYAVKSETHLWVVTLAHLATEGTLDAFDGATNTPLLDADTLLTRPAAGCYVCEQNYEPRLRRRRCPGEPRRSAKRGER